jgi:gamma-glutamylputrescine oxidase
VTALEPRRRGVSVTAGDAQCEAGTVVLATNAYSPQLVPSLKIQPTRAQMVATAPDPNPIADMPIYSNFGYRYWRQLRTGEVLLGGWRDTTLETEKTDDDRPTTEIQAHLDRALGDLRVSAAVTHRWAGTMGFTETGLPIAGPLEGMPNVYVCAGFTGHGMGFAFMTAKTVAEAI